MIVILLLAFSALSNVRIAEGKKIIHCYYPNWVAKRDGIAQLLSEKIDPFLCTHLTYVYAKLGESTYALEAQNPRVDLRDNGGQGMYRRLTDLKFTNTNLKVLLGMGGFMDSHPKNQNENDFASKYSILMRDPAKRANFIKKAVPFLSKHGFDGLEIHWEYPSLADKVNFAHFIEECKQEFEKVRLLLSINLATSPSIVEVYDINVISRYVDFVQLMTFDFHGYHEGVTNFISPLTSQNEYSVDKIVQMYKRLGLPFEKMLIGIATYAKSYTLSTENQNGVKSSTIGPGIQGVYTTTIGYLSYYEVCGPDWFRVSDSSGVNGAFAFKGKQWASFNDEMSVRAKVNYGLVMNLLGVSFWSFDQDDFTGNFCRSGAYPLIKAAKNFLHERGETSTGTPRMLENPEKSVDRCMTEGFYTDQSDCKKFYDCRKGILYSRQCGENLFWDQNCLCCILDNQHC